jgi:hypothetical protein
MIRSRLTWVIAGAVVALLVVAGVDVLRSSENETTASPSTGSTMEVATTTGVVTMTAGSRRLPPCTVEDSAVTVEVRRPNPESQPVATIVMRGVGTRLCFQDFHTRWPGPASRTALFVTRTTADLP